MTKSTERDFENEYLFRTCSVATILLTPLEFNPFRCATMFYHFRKTRSSYVDILFILRGSTATITGTGDYVAVPERFVQNEEPGSRNGEGTEKKSMFVLKSRYNRRIDISDM